MSSSPHQVPRCQANRPHAAASTFTLGARRTDTAGRALQLHGMGIVQVGTTWYGFGGTRPARRRRTPTSGTSPATRRPIWTHYGIALAKQASGDLGPNRIVERPKVLYNATTRMYVMYLHIDNTSYSDQWVGVPDR